MSRGRRQPIARSRFRLVTPARAGGVLGLLASLLAGYGLLTAQVFAIRSIDVSPLTYTDRSALLGSLGVGQGTNAFRLSTAGLVERIEALPAVGSASVAVALPDRLVVTVTERAPILAWGGGAVTFLVDRDGMLFHWLPTGSSLPAGLPTIIDVRTSSPVALSVGTPLDHVELDAATRLASITPADVGSSATGLVVEITDADGFIVVTTPGSWTAVFGTYGHVLRPPDLIPGQVRLLRSLLSGREAQIARVVLADDRNGTYVPLATNH
ncbi:MAG TPA: FtsQ-type POTRA domain-containing protein [Candidatus Binatus sp.]|nr:FtsQ-type POTRA domain-containing protein [Candidatus Binatus sp.]